MCIDEFQNAIDEIKKNEKDFTIIAMYANSLRERSDELQVRVTQQENESADFEGVRGSLEKQREEAIQRLEERNNQYERLESVKNDEYKQFTSLQQKEKKQKAKLEEEQRKVQKLEEQVAKLDQKYSDMEFKCGSSEKNYVSQLANLQHHLDSVSKDLAGKVNVLEEREKEIMALTKKGKQMMKDSAKNEGELKAYEKKYSKSKKKVKDLENEVISYADKLKFMQEQKKNEDLASHMESAMLGGGLGDELGDLMQANNGQNMMNNMEDASIEPDEARRQPSGVSNNSNFNADSRKNSLLQVENQEFYDQMRSMAENEGQEYREIQGSFVGQAYDENLPDIDAVVGFNGAYRSSFRQSVVEVQVEDQPDEGLELDDQEYDYGGVQVQEYEVATADQQTQTETEHKPIEIQTQTETTESKVALTQTIAIQHNDEDCQTEDVQTFSQEVQVDIKPEHAEMCCGDDRPYETIYMLWEQEAQDKLKKNL